MNLNNESIVFPTNHTKSILADVSYNAQNLKAPLVIFCHGYKGYKDWGAWSIVANQFAEAGCFFLKFNFSHNGGTIEDPIDFPDLDAFSKNNFSIEIEDLATVLDYLEKENEFSKYYDYSQIMLIGHSRGGGVSIIKAATDDRITQLISWASIAEIERRFPQGELLEQWKKDGVRYVTNGRTKQEMPHEYSFYEDFLTHKEFLNIESSTRSLKIPHLIINGTADTAVRTEEAQMLSDWSPQGKLYLLERCGHTFGTKHPWEREDLPIFMQEVVDKSIEFIGRT